MLGLTTTQWAIIVPAATAVLVVAITSWQQDRAHRRTLKHELKLALLAYVATTYEDMLERWVGRWRS